MRVFLLALLAAACAANVCPRSPDRSCQLSAREGAIECPYTVANITKKVYCKPVTTTDDNTLGSTCTFKIREACAAPTVVCAAGVRPKYTNCCPDCKVPDVKPTCKVPPTCEAPTLPKIENGCLTCKYDVSRCTVTQYAECQKKELPTCAEGEKPARTSDCCLTCEPAISACGKTSDLFNRVTKCATEFKDLPECAADTRPKFNTDTCCLSCRIAAVKPPATGTCTVAEFQACAAAVTECAAGETPTRTNGCCWSCKRPERKCSFVDVVKGCSKTPACEDGEKPAPVEGSCCFSCRPVRPRPECSVACSDKEVCVRTKAGPVCKAAIVRKLVVKATKAVDAIKTAIADAVKDKEKARTAILEIVKRCCDKPENEKICTLLHKLRERFVVKPNSDGTVDVVIAEDEDEEEASTTTFRPVDLLNAATNDLEARGDVTVTDEAKLCPRVPTKEHCTKAAADTTYTQSCEYFGNTYFCKPQTSIPEDSTTPPMTCSSEKMRACSRASLPVCAVDERPKFDFATCCPSCKFSKPTTEAPTCALPAECAAGVKPARDDKGCVTCRVPVSKCTDAQYAACKASFATLPTCASDEKPVRTTDCCISCKPAPSACGERKDTEGFDRKTACATDFKSLPVCASDKKPEFDRDTCCLTCRREFKPPAAAKCTLDEFKTCMAKVHTCETGEKPERTKGCCPSCRRPERKCKVKEVVERCAKVPACTDGAKPVRVEGSCCPTCRPTRKCATACTGGGEKCRLVKGAEVCQKVKARLYKMAWGKALSGLTADTATEAIKEIVKRFCDREEPTPKMCEKKDELIDNIVARISNRDDKSKTVDVEVDVDAPATRRRLLQAESSLLDAALKDEEACGEFEFVAPGGTAPPTTSPDIPSSSTAAAAGAAAIALPLLLL